MISEVKKLINSYHWEITAEDNEHIAANLPVKDGFEYPTEFSAWDDDGKGVLLRLYAVVAGDDEVALGPFLVTIQPDEIDAECDSFDGPMYESLVMNGEDVEKRLREMLKFMDDTLEICQQIREHKLSFEDAAEEYKRKSSKTAY